MQARRPVLVCGESLAFGEALAAGRSSSTDGSSRSSRPKIDLRGWEIKRDRRYADDRRGSRHLLGETMVERERTVPSGWVMLPVVLAGWVAGALLVTRAEPVAGIGCILASMLLAKGLFTLQPNEARVLVLFGRYVGTVRKEGFHWVNPFAVQRGPFVIIPSQDGKDAPPVRNQPRHLVSLRTRTFETATLKVNDQRGNPIEIAGVIVWRVADTAKALFDVDDYEQYVRTQSETALRHLANRHPYDPASEGVGPEEVTLRDAGDAVGDALERELEERLRQAGVAIVEARLTHLAYSPEIAHTMLRRQAADAVISARRKIVEGAVSMVEMALDELTRKQVLTLDDAHRATMVGNLLVVLCGESAAEPVVSVGSKV
jgi:regulator of protease activity HflC (stomatin/prohibitin superfamily)